MSVVFSVLESHMKDLVCALIVSDKRIGEIVTWRMSFQSLCDLAENLFLYKINDKELLIFIKDLMPQVRYCGEGRNAYMHSSWYLNDPYIPYIRSKPKFKNRIYYDHQQCLGNVEIIDLSDLIEETSAGVFELILHMQSRGFTNQLQIPCSLPEKFSISFQPKKKLIKPWTEM